VELQKVAAVKLNSAKFESFIVNIYCAAQCSLKKQTLKFTPLYLLNRKRYSDEICRISCANARTEKYESLAKLRAVVSNILKFF